MTTVDESDDSAAIAGGVIAAVLIVLGSIAGVICLAGLIVGVILLVVLGGSGVLIAGGGATAIGGGTALGGGLFAASKLKKNKNPKPDVELSQSKNKLM